MQLQFADYCAREECSSYANCGECRELSKRLAGRYSESQGELEKLHRERKAGEVGQLVSLQLT